MDVLGEDQALQAVLGQSDFVGGIENESLFISHLDEFINEVSDTGNNFYFNDMLPPAVVGPVAESGGSPNHQVNNKRLPEQVYTHPHNLPESPPDSGSEPPYSPPDPTAHSPHQKQASNGNSGNNTSATNLAQDLLYHHHHQLYHSPLPHQAGIGSKQPQQQQQHVSSAETLLVPHPVLTPMLTQQPPSPASSNSQPPPATTPGLPMLGLVHSPSTLALAAAGLSTSGEQLAGLSTVYPSLQQSAPKKRKLDMVQQEGGVLVKQEPELSPDSNSNQTGFLEDDYPLDITGESGMYQQCIRFTPFQQTSWHILCDQNLKDLAVTTYRVDADKGFNFSNADEAFVCQKKNHFQITCHAQLQGDAQFVTTSEGLKKINSFHLHFYGVKVESQSQTIKVEQSQSDRSKKPFHPVPFDLQGGKQNKMTVGRLHFSETTSNNMRKKGKPNPDQRYFYLVVGLHAHTADGKDYPIVSHASERIIVRASNPGQFESDVELCWQKGHTQDSIFHNGRVGINTDRPDEAMVIYGNLKVTGHIMSPSDQRAKESIQECDTRKQLYNVKNLRVVRYQLTPDFAQHSGLEKTSVDTGVIAQEVQKVLPEAVQPAGDIELPNGQRIENFLVVNKDRIFMENVGAVKELCKVTDNLENRIDELERINRRLVKLKRMNSIVSNSSVSTVTSKSSGITFKRRRCHHKDVDDSLLWSNKFIQICIVILVLIMAFCLVAMATLYFLEFQKRQDSSSFYNGHNFSNHIGQHSTVPILTFNQSTSPNVNTIPLASSYYPSNSPIFIKYKTTPSKSEPYVLPSIIEGNNVPKVDDQIIAKSHIEPPGNNHMTSGDHSVMESSIIDLEKSSPATLGRPQNCPLLGMGNAQFYDVDSSNCQSVCCTLELQIKNLESMEITASSTRENSQDIQLKHKYGHSVSHDSRPTVATGTHDKHENDMKIPQVTLDSASNTVKKENSTSVKQLENRVKRDTDDINKLSEGIELVNPVIIVRGTDFNQTLDLSYMIGYSEQTSTNYTYKIPLSRYLLDDTIELQFQHLPHLHVQPCTQERNTLPCQADNIDRHLQEVPVVKPHEHEINVFHIHVRSFLQAVLCFRSPLNNNFDHLCTQPKDKLGNKFIEYNIIFYRDCAEK